MSSRWHLINLVSCSNLFVFAPTWSRFYRRSSRCYVLFMSGLTGCLYHDGSVRMQHEYKNNTRIASWWSPTVYVITAQLRSRSQWILQVEDGRKFHPYYISALIFHTTCGSYQTSSRQSAAFASLCRCSSLTIHFSVWFHSEHCKWDPDLRISNYTTLDCINSPVISMFTHSEVYRYLTCSKTVYSTTFAQLYNPQGSTASPLSNRILA